MPSTIGSHLGTYEILALIGAGGMGEVYRARDMKLNRQVALKVLPEFLASDQERLGRLHREAQMLALLNHPRIAQVYGLEGWERREGLSSAFIVMELVDGEDLAQRIARGPIPLDEALLLARQIGEALEAAHEQGVIHRDLKPANIRIRPDGSVKVLDFGLAKALDGPGNSSAQDVSRSPTITTPAMTHAGVILGTAAYMSPEQARGKAVDKRTDIWAFGCVFYEMLTGRRAFSGDEVTDTLAFIITKEIDWTVVPASVPPSIRAVIAKCLQKDRVKRRSDIRDVLLDLDDASTDLANPRSLTNDSQTPAPALQAASRWRPAVPWAIVALLGAGLLTALVAGPRSRSAGVMASPMRLTAELGVDASLVNNQGDTAVLSPDGKVIAFVAQTAGGRPQIFVRRLDEFAGKPLAGTDTARGVFFSPDGQWLGFFADGKLKKIAVTGGAAVVLADAPDDRGGSWTNNGEIVFVANSTLGAPIQRVSDAGGRPEPLVEIAKDVGARFPRVLPGEKALLYTSTRSTGAADEADIVVQPLPSGTPKVLFRGAFDARYVPSGHLLYMHSGTLFAAGFDASRLEILSSPTPVLDEVTANSAVGSALYSVSDNGVMVYLTGGSVGNEVGINWLNRDGKVSLLRSTPANWSNPQFSPDGRQLAVDIFDGRQSDIWTYDWARDTLTRFTFDAADDLKPVWTPDGKRIVFRSTRDNSPGNLYWQRADGAGDVQRLTENPSAVESPGSWHPSGRFLAFTEGIGPGNPDILILPMEGSESEGWKPGKPTRFLSTPAVEVEPAFSPDGRWIAYQSNESGSFEIYVRPFPGPGGKWQISTSGGSSPTWSRTRPELLYASPTGEIFVSHYTVEGESFRADKPSSWSAVTINSRPRQRSFDLHSDGDRIAASVRRGAEFSKIDRLRIVVNFFDELRRLAPATKK